MRICFVGDPHLKVSNLEVSGLFLGRLRERVAALQPDAVLIAGDLFDTHSIIRSEIMNLWVDYFETAPCFHVALVGNHDYVGGGSHLHALAALKKVVEVVDTPYYLDGAWFLPYISPTSEFAAAVEICRDAGDGDVLFCHQTFDGARYDNGFFAPDGVPTSVVAGFKKVISGHIHKRQEFANIWYPGSPFAHSFNDAGEQKYIWLIDTETFEAKPYDLELPAYYVWNVELAGAMALLKNIVDTNMTHHHHKLVMRGPKAEVAALQDSSEFKAYRKQIQSLVVCPEYIDVVVQSERISDAVTPEQMLQTYVSDIMKTDLDRGKLLEATMKLLRGEV